MILQKPIARTVFLTNIVLQTVADEKRVVDEQRRTLDEEIADFQRRKVGGFPLSLLLQSIVSIQL